MASEFPKDTIGQPPAGGGMIGRIKRLLMSPKTEWAAIDAEPMTTQGILTAWVAPLAAIGPIAHLIQGQVFPMSIFGVTWRPPLVGSVVTAIITWALIIAMTYVWALIIDALAPSFGGTKNSISALKVAAFSATAGWIGAVLGILPMLGIIGALLGLYNIYLFWIGGPMLMKVPQDKAVGYVIVSIVVGIIANILAGIVALAIAGAMFAMTPGAGVLGTPGGGSITVGGTTIDAGKLDAAAASIKESTDKMQASLTANGGAGAKAVDPTALQNLIPASLSGWNRTSIESSGGGAMGVNISDATAQFAAGDQSFHLKISDTGAMGSLAGLVNVTSSKQTATGYEKTALQDGNMVTEKWDNESKQGTYSVLVGKRFLVEAEGSAPSIDVLKGAVGSVNLGSLASLAS
ncbi:Yip1 family protein [Sphingomonas bacterium]|uniref:Yip1 family protein n=1 Tax=Sphingomonas bacterium TaxID=1895847 RepID=UPI00263049F2|nr:Yip1 family protein [Sphingomonas bacterium]MDB5678469.1 hypothetical protein [Sphingomonas bacterium]